VAIPAPSSPLSVSPTGTQDVAELRKGLMMEIQSPKSLKKMSLLRKDIKIGKRYSADGMEIHDLSEKVGKQ
jgi:hypothetical protein